MYRNPEMPSHPGGPSPSDLGWIYVAYDVRELNECKIGLTRGSLWARMRDTTNPYYALFAAFRVPSSSHAEILQIEAYLQRKAGGGRPISHFRSGRDSEWYPSSPDSALLYLIEIFPNCFGEAGLVTMDMDGVDFTQCIYLPQLHAEQLSNADGAFAPNLLQFHANGGDWLAGMTPDEISRYRNQFGVRAPSNLVDRICFYLHRRARP